MELSIARDRGSLKRDTGLAVDRRRLKALHHRRLETAGRLSKGNFEVACILVEDDYQPLAPSPPAAYAVTFAPCA